MNAKVTAGIEEHFRELQDPRIDRTKLHKLIDILVIAICAVICGADTWEDIAAFGEAKKAWFEKFLELPNGIPSHDTFNRVFNRLDPQQFERCFMRWINAASDLIAGQVIAMDGKLLRRSHDNGIGKAAIDMVSAWADSNRLVLGQIKVNDKSNEITAIPQLLKALEVSGCIVTIDALGCQTEIAETIVDQGADYVLALKENQGRLYEDVKLLFDDLESSDYRAYSYDHVRTVNKDHGRMEIRECWTISDPEILCHLRGSEKWKHLKTVSRIRSQRQVGDKQSTEDRYHIASICGAQRVLHAARSHWGIENKLHWVLDIAFDEDRHRLRKGHGPENFAILRHIALNLLKHETSLKRSIKGKRLVAGWNEDYLLKILSGFSSLG
ncbi:ISAs1 family transposase [Candidatus Parcubacteria bacterium]|nr:MAG: ISAs1 family transposase [Candidatus Parcubacteria bacterium]